MVSPSHILLLGLLILLALVVFGPKRLPELGGSIGRAIQEFRRASTQAVTEIRAHTDPSGPAPPPTVPPSPPVAAAPAEPEPIETGSRSGDAPGR
ncbi:MAG TPA: twin-arginine translocase TatA/TatE family subunit [Candidatus Micrarchaeia archaeon]|nr:twin-arginine translocase TatA/TatE family subunit [Candidatus Micrarchaeia archaeon]